MPAIDVERIATARQVRERFAEYLATGDDARETTVRLAPDAPRRVVDEVRAEAVDTKAERAQNYGQAALTRAERRDVDFSRPGVNVPKLRAIKSLALGKGVSNWRDYLDPTLTVDEHREIFDRRAGDEAGYGRSRGNERESARREARAVRAERRERAGHARRAALLELDEDAIEFLRADEGPGLDYAFSRDDRGVFRASGEGGEAAAEVHAERSRRARRVDERRSATITTDPVEWARAPDRLDLPGIDTVAPGRVHDRRSERARALDEDRRAPLADSPAEWARNVDRLDWPGVDTPPTAGLDDVVGDLGVFEDGRR